MSGASFADLHRQAFERYGADDYAAAMGVARLAASAFPERDRQPALLEWILGTFEASVACPSPAFRRE